MDKPCLTLRMKYPIRTHSIFFFRNTDKSQALDFKNLLVFLLKVICDVVSRVAILGAWLYTTKDGKFSIEMVTGYFYTIALVNFLENLAFSIHKGEDYVSFRNLTGM